MVIEGQVCVKCDAQVLGGSYRSGLARGGSGIPIYLLFCPKDTNIPQNRKMCDTKYLKLFGNRILNT